MGKHVLTLITHFKQFTTFSINTFFEIVTYYKMKQPTLQAKLSTMQAAFPQIVSWIDQIPLEKWTQAYDQARGTDT